MHKQRKSSGVHASSRKPMKKCAMKMKVELELEKMMYGTALMQRRTCSTTRCSLHARSPRLPSRVGKLATQKSLYTWFTAKHL